MSDRLAVLPQYLLPKQALTAFGGRVASTAAGPATTRLIEWFIRRYRVDMSEAAQADAAAYKTFNEFFTRALKPQARPIAAAGLVCPVDGAVSQHGRIEGDQVFQAKGHHYSTTALVGGDEALAGQFHNGHFATIYLSPRDYHRVHMPCDGRLRRMIHVPGALFSVNPVTARGVPGLFARIRAPLGESPNTLLVPDSVIGRDQAGAYVLTVDKDDVVHRSGITPGQMVGTLRVAESGLTADDRVIVDGLQRAVPGAKVTPKEASSPTAGDATAKPAG